MDLRWSKTIKAKHLQTGLKPLDQGGLLNRHVFIIGLQGRDFSDFEFQQGLLIWIFWDVSSPVIVDLVIVHGDNPRRCSMRCL